MYHIDVFLVRIGIIPTGTIPGYLIQDNDQPPNKIGYYLLFCTVDQILQRIKISKDHGLIIIMKQNPWYGA